MARGLELVSATQDKLYINVTGLDGVYPSNTRTVTWQYATKKDSYGDPQFKESYIDKNTIPAKETTFEGCIEGLSPNTTYYIYALIQPEDKSWYAYAPEDPDDKYNIGGYLEAKTLSSGGGLPVIDYFNVIQNDGETSVAYEFKVSNLGKKADGVTSYVEFTCDDKTLHKYIEGTSSWLSVNQNSYNVNKNQTYTFKLYAENKYSDGTVECVEDTITFTYKDSEEPEEEPSVCDIYFDNVKVTENSISFTPKLKGYDGEFNLGVKYFELRVSNGDNYVVVSASAFINAEHTLPLKPNTKYTIELYALMSSNEYVFVDSITCTTLEEEEKDEITINVITDPESGTATITISGTKKDGILRVWINGGTTYPDDTWIKDINSLPHTLELKKLEPNTTYTIKLTRDGENGVQILVAQTEFIIFAVASFAWTYAGMKRNYDGTYEVVEGKTKGENGAIYYLTADEWNAFLGKINEVRESCGLDGVSFNYASAYPSLNGRNVVTKSEFDNSGASTNCIISYDNVRQAVDAIMGISPTVSEEKRKIIDIKRGDRITAEFFNTIVDVLNSALE